MPESEKKKFSFKEFWKEFIVPVVKEWLPDILKFIFKNWGAVALATTTIISTGGFVYEKIAYDSLRTSVDNAIISSQSDLDKLKSEIKQLSESLDQTRRDLESSLSTIERQSLTIRQLQDTNLRLQNTNRELERIFTGLSETGDQLRIGELGVAELIKEGIRLNRLLQDEIGRNTKTSK